MGDCEGWQIPAVLGSMATRYKAAIGDDYFISESDYQWSMFYSVERTARLETRSTPVGALEGLKKILFKEVLKIYPYDEHYEAPGTLRPFLERLRDSADESIWDFDGDPVDHSYYKALKRELYRDFSRVWMINVGMRPEDPALTSSALKSVFLLGQTSCGHWVGLRTFSVET